MRGFCGRGGGRSGVEGRADCDGARRQRSDRGAGAQAVCDRGACAVQRRALRAHKPRKLDGAQEAQLIVAFGTAQGSGGVESVAGRADGGAVRRARRGFVRDDPRRSKKRAEAVVEGPMVHPPKQSGEFVWRMEDVLDVYCRPYDPRVPQVCMDETNKQLLGRFGRRPVLPGHPAHIDNEYWHGQPLPVLRAAAWLATHRTANQSRLGGSDPGAGRRRVMDNTRPSGQARHPSHPQAWQLAQHRRNRVERPGASVPGPPGSTASRRSPTRSRPGRPTRTPASV